MHLFQTLLASKLRCNFAKRDNWNVTKGVSKLKRKLLTIYYFSKCHQLSSAYMYNFWIWHQEPWICMEAAKLQDTLAFVLCFKILNNYLRFQTTKTKGWKYLRNIRIHWWAGEACIQCVVCERGKAEVKSCIKEREMPMHQLL